MLRIGSKVRRTSRGLRKEREGGLSAELASGGGRGGEERGRGRRTKSPAVVRQLQRAHRRIDCMYRRREREVEPSEEGWGVRRGEVRTRRVGGESRRAAGVGRAE